MLFYIMSLVYVEWHSVGTKNVCELEAEQFSELIQVTISQRGESLKDSWGIHSTETPEGSCPSERAKLVLTRYNF